MIDQCPVRDTFESNDLASPEPCSRCWRWPPALFLKGLNHARSDSRTGPPAVRPIAAEAAPDMKSLPVATRPIVDLRRLPGVLGQPDLLATLLRQGHHPQWLQSTWAGITPLLADGLPRDYRLTRAVGIFGQVMAEYVLTYMLGHEREVLARLVSQVERKWDNRMGQSLAGRKVLIVGTGDIGQSVAHSCLPWRGVVRIASQPGAAPFIEVSGRINWAAWWAMLTCGQPAQHANTPTLRRSAVKHSSRRVVFNVGGGVAVVDADWSRP